MTEEYKDKLYQALTYAVTRAIAEIGMDEVKKCSMFMSNKVPMK